jgi:hypothetical protein
MFNPKENLLDQQLAVSGLEMNIFGILDGGAGKRNKQRREAYEEQKKFNQKVADLTNEHNDKLDQADKDNYYAMRDFSHETNMQKWQRGAEIQDFNYLQSLKQYQKSMTIGNAQLGLNAEAEAQAVDEEQAAIQEAFIQHQFEHDNNLGALKQAYFEGSIDKQGQQLNLQGIKNRASFGAQNIQANIKELSQKNAMDKETAMVESLLAQGEAQLGQAGKSTAKGAQANMAALQRSLMALDGELSGRNRQAAIQLAELQADTSLELAGVGLNIERIENTIANAEETARTNQEVMRQNMKSTIAQTERNLRQIALDRQFADINTREGMMLFPERLSYDPAPELTPERVFVDRMEAIPGFVPPPVTESRFGGFLNTLGSIASIATPFIKP